MVQVGQPLLAIVPLEGVWVIANFKETQVGRVRPGQPATIRVDTFPDRVFRGRVDSISAGTGVPLQPLPPENASGNWVKVVQRVPVKIVLEDYQRQPAPPAGRHVRHGHHRRPVASRPGPEVPMTAESAPGGAGSSPSPSCWSRRCRSSTPA